MTLQTACDVWSELKLLYERLLHWEKKLDEKIGDCPVWISIKHYVYMSFIVVPSLILLLTIGLFGPYLS